MTAASMTPGLGFALGAMLCFGTGDLIYKRAAANGIAARHFAMLQAFVFCPAVTLYAWLTGTLAPQLSALWGSLAGFFLLIAVNNFLVSLKSGAVSTNAAIFRLNFTITAALAVLLLGEPLNAQKLAALTCALIAVWLLLAEPGAHGKRPDPPSFLRVVAATVAMALANFFHKVGLLHGAMPETLVSAQAWTFTALATLIAFVRDRGYKAPPRAWRYAPFAAIALAIAFVLLLYGLARGPASVLVPVAQMSFVITALFGIVIFRERLDMRKGLGLAVAIAALALFAVS
jgi:drug/metabolite transporter (DMT)-like permease